LAIAIAQVVIYCYFAWGIHSYSLRMSAEMDPEMLKLLLPNYHNMVRQYLISAAPNVLAAICLIAAIISIGRLDRTNETIS